MIQWTRPETLCAINFYGIGATKPDAREQHQGCHEIIQEDIYTLGRVGWIIGGDWNQQPEAVHSTWQI